MIGGLGPVIALGTATELAQDIQLLKRLQSSKDTGIMDLIAALDARLRVIEEQLGIESPVIPQADDPVAALEAGEIEEDGGTA